VELVKRRALLASQHGLVRSGAAMTADVSVARLLLRQHGPAGLFRGWRLMAAGCALSYAAWFALNDLLLAWAEAVGVRKTGLTTFVCGGLAGCGAKVLHSPFDVVHTLYVSSASLHPTYRGIFQDELAAVGPRFLVRGLSLGLVRSFLRTGIVMYSYGQSKSWIRRHQDSLA
ncbi:unnamed protein product, partial [Polarella glacialis]